MTTKWDPSSYKDDYHEMLKKVVEEKIEHGDRELPKPARRKQKTNVIDLVSVLQQSIDDAQGKSHGASHKARKKAA
jgi:DNA end-binding protein Ku